MTDEGLLLEDSMPVSLEAIESWPEDGQLLLCNDANEWFLRASLALHDSPEADEHDEVRMELRRMDLKLRLLMDMVGELLQRQLQIPAPKPVKLTPLGITVQADGSHAPGDRLALALYINPLLPRALRLFGSVERVEEGGRLSIRFHGLSQGAQDWLEKLIFRHHRRTVALGRAKAEF